MTRFVGIDPGAKGSFCLLDTVTKDIQFQATPSTNTTPNAIFAWLYQEHLDDPIRLIGLEEVHSIYGMSAKSNFSFGYNVGQVHTIADMTKIGVDLIQPKVWQAGCGIRFKRAMKASDKKVVVATTALRLYPSAPLYGPKGGLLDGRADALMIAHYLSIKYGGE